MDSSKLIQEIVETYQKHGWQMRRILLRPETRAVVEHRLPSGTVDTEDSAFDGL
jgi:hypothetical protein